MRFKWFAVANYYRKGRSVGGHAGLCASAVDCELSVVPAVMPTLDEIQGLFD